MLPFFDKYCYFPHKYFHFSNKYCYFPINTAIFPQIFLFCHKKVKKKNSMGLPPSLVMVMRFINGWIQYLNFPSAKWSRKQSHEKIFGHPFVRVIKSHNEIDENQHAAGAWKCFVLLGLEAIPWISSTWTSCHRESTNHVKVDEKSACNKIMALLCTQKRGVS